MTSDDLSGRIARKALAAASGDARQAERLLLQWCEGDVRLLAGLVRPYLQGIVAHVLSQQAKDGGTPKRSARRGLSEQAFDVVVGALEQRIGASHEPVGLTALVEPPTPPKAGARHERALRQVAAAYIAKRIDAAESRGPRRPSPPDGTRGPSRQRGVSSR